ncbi:MULTISPECIES: hypothetical protein [unclassified Rhizobium]|uniref:hypothetical protein n=1 Tax=unclassified Rhizobium TaxID=2613769 RepID=UPI000B534FA4|nr:MULTISPECIES: hypothetical protein [unclassified Rhizobium]
MSLCSFARCHVLAVAAVLLLPVNGVVAGKQVAPEQSMADFMNRNPDCTEFGDQCSICAVVDGKAACSTPKIACIKAPYVCTRRRGD